MLQTDLAQKLILCIFDPRMVLMISSTRHFVAEEKPLFQKAQLGF